MLLVGLLLKGLLGGGCNSLPVLVVLATRIGKIYNHRMVTTNSQPVVRNYASKVLTGNYPKEANQEGIVASSR